jgi:uncharacterized protein
MNEVIGRKEEKAILSNALMSARPELIVVYGRRRIGKTYLIRGVYKNYIQFEFSGINNASLQEQLKNFHLALSAKRAKSKMPADWIEAFHQLSHYFDSLKSKNKKVLFIDEFPWLDTRKSNFLPAFDNFWNGWGSKRSDLVVVICGSAASYMIKSIIKNKGGLHNRLTQSISLTPFNLYETELFLRYNKIKLGHYDILQLYMAMGGVPYYLEKIKPGESVAQALDRLCFNKNGFLRLEFSHVFASLFDEPDNHDAIIRTLATVRKGLTRNQIVSKIKINTGGTLTKTLTDLEESGFIEKYIPYKGTKDSVYRITDEYSMFYLKFIENTKPTRDAWMKIQGQPSYKIWSGFSFETICIKHIEQIKEALKIRGIQSTHGSWIEKSSKKGSQIDLLIDRDDNVINLCEVKFYAGIFTIDKKYAQEIANKTDSFYRSTKTKKSIFITFITTYGVAPNQYSRQYVQNELTMDDLFTEL